MRLPPTIRLAASLALLAGCERDQQASPLVLYLRQGLPPRGTSYDLINPTQRDLGSLQLAPPSAPESRDCGDVVAFGSALQDVPSEGLQLRELLYRVWWSAGGGRGVFGLNAPGLPSALGQRVVSSCCQPEAGIESGYSWLSARVPAQQALSAEQLQRLFLTFHGVHSTVQLGSCPGRLSMVVLNPPTDAELSGRDLDGDGVDDLEELRGFRDPFAADAGSEPCLVPVAGSPARELPALPALPEAQRELEQHRVDGELTIKGEVLSHQGELQVSGKLRLEDATLLLQPGAGPTEHPILRVESGARLEMVSSTLAPLNGAQGFHLRAERGSQVRLSCTVGCCTSKRPATWRTAPPLSTSRATARWCAAAPSPTTWWRWR